MSFWPRWLPFVVAPKEDSGVASQPPKPKRFMGGYIMAKAGEPTPEEETDGGGLWPPKGPEPPTPVPPPRPQRGNMPYIRPRHPEPPT